MDVTVDPRLTRIVTVVKDEHADTISKATPEKCLNMFFTDLYSFHLAFKI